MTGWTQHFFLGSALYGIATRYAITTHGELQAPTGVAFFCPTCGAVWAHCPVAGEPTFPLLRSCKAHGRTFYEHAGSLWLSWDRDFTSALPRKLLLRETLLALEHYDQYSPI